MTTRTMTLTVTMNEDETLAVDSANRGIPFDKMGEGMFRALEGQILSKIAEQMNTEPTQEMRHALAASIRLQTQKILNETPTVDNAPPSFTTTIPEGVDDVEG
jgi:hypothetical protein